MTEAQLDRQAIDTIRFLSVDMVQAAKSGHPGLPLGAAPMAYVLWSRFLRHNPRNPGFWDRDRFVLSAGHGSALLYSLLHLTGYDLSREQLQQFRQWGSLTPGHPERGLTPGVEASTGPLGQGMGNALGMAIAEAHLAERFNRPGHTLFDHYSYVLAGDGDMMEGVESEAASLAGHLGLGKLIVLYDSNHVTLSATTSLSFSEDVGARHQAYGWHVQAVGDGNDVAAIERAIRAAQETRDRPSLIIVQTVLGYGAPHKQGTFEAHGNPLGPDEVRATKQNLGWPVEPPFQIPADVLAHMRRAVDRGAELERDWQARFEAYRREFPELARELERRFAGELPQGWSAALPTFAGDSPAIATRKASESVLQAIARAVPELVGGSGDLDPSTYTGLQCAGDFESSTTSLRAAQGLLGGGTGFAGRNIHFGVREHAMAAAVNGMAYHGGVLPFAATFLVFSDYMRAPLRMAALAELRAIFVFTHDSIGVGEDGPTHQPIEQLASLRAIPQLQVIRPADANETRWAWQVAVEHTAGPTALVFSRQNLPVLDRSLYAPAEMLRYGAYVLNLGSFEPDLILIASGSEVQLIVAAEPLLRAQGLRARLVSMPCWRLFEQQLPEYRESVLPENVRARLAVEAGSPLGWERYVGLDGAVLGIDRFGASAPAATLFEQFGFSVQRVVERALLMKTDTASRADARTVARQPTAPTRHPIVSLFDVDNTLLDNDRVIADLQEYLQREVGGELARHYFTIFEQLRSELGYADYLGALQRFRLAYPHEPCLLAISSYLVNYPFANRLFPGALDAIQHLGRFGPTVILSDGDVLFQPRKIECSGIAAAVSGRVLIYVHKETQLAEVERRYPADHYVLVDDKLRILTEVKRQWGARVTTVFPRQGHYALDPQLADYPAPDISIARIGDLLEHGFSAER